MPTGDPIPVPPLPGGVTARRFVSCFEGLDGVIYCYHCGYRRAVLVQRGTPLAPALLGRHREPNPAAPPCACPKDADGWAGTDETAGGRLS